MGDEDRANLEIGRILRLAREDRGLSLEEVEQATKIRARYLDGLEREDYEALPGAIYVRGFLKTYADYLGLDGEELVRELKNRQTPVSERTQERGSAGEKDFDRLLINPEESGSSGSRRLLGIGVPVLVLAAVVVVLLVGALYMIGRGAQSEQGAGDSGAPPDNAGREGAARDSGEKPSAPDKTVEETTAGAEETTGGPKTTPESASEPQTPGSASEDVLRAKITVSDRPSWIRIEADGDTAFEQLAEPGFSDTFEAEREISILVGDAGAVEAEVNGQSVGVLGDSGEVLTRRFTLKPGT